MNFSRKVLYYSPSILETSVVSMHMKGKVMKPRPFFSTFMVLSECKEIASL
jgi:hypothetical protein